MRKRTGKRLKLLSLVLVLAGASLTHAAQESYDASVMRLLHYEGDVEIENEDGSPGLLMENIRFDSGQALKTGEDASASVSLDSKKIVTLDSESRVEFSKEGDALTLSLTDGSLFLDVQEKLEDKETLDIQTSTMTVGIRGTIVYASNDGKKALEKLAGENQSLNILADDQASILGVLEGTATITWNDESGAAQTMRVPAGKMAVLPMTSDGKEKAAAPVPILSEIHTEDVPDFVREQIQDSPVLTERVSESSGIAVGSPDPFPADGTWEWTDTVTLVAQSASKLYDGTPLTRPGDILVYGLPSNFSIKAAASGSRIDAGESDNVIENYAIFNSAGEDVTSHFTSIEKVSGTLVVDPAPLTVWTGSAEKTYDGTSLTSNDAMLRTVPGYEANQPVWRDSSYVRSDSTGGEVMYGICGSVWVHGTNPLTGEVREIELQAGQKMTVYLNTEDGKESIELKIDTVPVEKLPEDVLRLYADNPDLAAQACKDAKWDPDELAERIKKLPKAEYSSVEEKDLQMVEGTTDRLMLDSTNVRIHIDTQITDYNGVSLGSQEAHYTPVTIDPSIKVKATGSQTKVGESKNTYEIDWGGANPANYKFVEDLGTLTVTSAEAVVTTGSAKKEYDGTPLTCEEAEITGLAAGEKASVVATGTITDVGTAENTFTISWGDTDPANYTVTSNTGTLEITERKAFDTVTFTAASDEKTYDGTPLSNPSVTAAGLPEGMTYTAAATGSRTDAGTSANVVSSYTIFDENGTDVTQQFKDIRTADGTLTVNPAAATVTTGSASRAYDGTALTNAQASISGLASSDSATVRATGTITDVGSTENTYVIDWNSTNADNYTIAEQLGTLEVTVNKTAIVVTAPSGKKTYDGTPLTPGDADVTGLPEGFSFTAKTAGSQKDAGSSESTVSDIVIRNSGGADVTKNFAGITTVNGTLTVDPADLTIISGSAKKAYDGKPLTCAEASFNGLSAADSMTIEPTASITDVGTAENTFTVSWGSTNPGNYTVSQQNGTLEVTPADLTIESGSAKKPYDGKELTCTDVTITGLAESDTLTVTTNGASITRVGTKTNDFTVDWGTTKPENYNLTEVNGMLEVTVNDTPIVITAPTIDKVYNGSVQNGEDAENGKYVTVEGLPGDLWGYGIASGELKDVGSGSNDIENYMIGDEDEEDVTAFFSNITLVSGTLTITPRPLRIETGSASKEYDGTALTCTDVTVSGLAPDETINVTAEGSITTAGTADNTYVINWGGVKPGNYQIVDNLGTLTVSKRPVIIDLHGYTTTFDAYPHLISYATAAYGDGTAIECTEEAVYPGHGEIQTGTKVRLTLMDGLFEATFDGVTEIGTHTITPSATAATALINNYSISYVNNVIVITEKEWHQPET